MWFINLSDVLTVCCSEPAVCCRFPFQNRDVLRLLTDTFGLKHVQTPLQHSSCPLLSVPWVLQLYHPWQTDERANSQSVVHQMIFSVISLWPKRVSSWDVKMKRSHWWTLAVHGTRVPFSFSPTTLPFSCYQPGLYLSSSSSEVIWCLYCTFYSHQTSLEVWLFFGALRKVLRKAFPSNLMEHRLVWCDCCHSKVAYYSVAFSPQAAESFFFFLSWNYNTFSGFQPIKNVWLQADGHIFKPHMQIAQYSSNIWSKNLVFQTLLMILPTLITKFKHDIQQEFPAICRI